jgi:molybdopterin-containing oxidoreductase family membrane subunit
MRSDTKLQELSEDLKPRKFNRAGKIWLILLGLVILNGLFSYYQQLTHGLEVTAMSNHIIWGIYISNFVFFVAVSLVGSLISAILRLSKAKWSVPLTRIAEVIAVASIIFAGLIIIVDMGRPDRVYNLIIHGRLQSPIVWDVLVVTTYLAISLLFLYIPSLPDLAILRDRMKNIPKWQHKMYKVLSLNWIGTEKQYKILHRSVRVLSILIIPVALGIHTVTSWLFASTFRPGWNSTNFGPYFVAGAFVVGAAAVISVMYIMRRYYHLEKYLTREHFNKMGKLMVMLSLVYLYFTINEYLTPAYKMAGHEEALLKDLFVGDFAPLFWGVQVLGMALPIVLMLFRWGRRPMPLFIISIVIVVGAWFKRFLIVVPTLFHPFLPIEAEGGLVHYFPTWHKWSITIGSLAGALLIITLLLRYLPPISIWEMAEEKEVEEGYSPPTPKFAGK